MAMADYCRCDVCKGKAFYDANITDSRYNAAWDETEDADPVALAVLCSECAKTRAVAVLPEGMTGADVEALATENARLRQALDDMHRHAQVLRNGCEASWDIDPRRLRSASRSIDRASDVITENQTTEGET